MQATSSVSRQSKSSCARCGTFMPQRAGQRPAHLVLRKSARGAARHARGASLATDSQAPARARHSCHCPPQDQQRAKGRHASFRGPAASRPLFLTPAKHAKVAGVDWGLVSKKNRKTLMISVLYSGGRGTEIQHSLRVAWANVSLCNVALCPACCPPNGSDALRRSWMRDRSSGALLLRHAASLRRNRGYSLASAGFNQRGVSPALRRVPS